MLWDLRGSLLKKEERESARLADFEFKLRARTFRLLAETLVVLPAEIVGLIAKGDNATVLPELAKRYPDRVAVLDASYTRCSSAARTQLSGGRRPVALSPGLIVLWSPLATLSARSAAVRFRHIADIRP